MPHTESFITPQGSSPQIEFSLTEYEQRLHEDGVRTGRHASQEGRAPEAAHIKLATALIREKIKPMFAEDAELATAEETQFDSLKDRYWQRASRVGAEHGAKAGFELEDYFETGDYRSYFSLKRELLARSPEGSLAHSLLGAIDLYHKTLQINPAFAAGIVCEMVSRGRGEIGNLAAQKDDGDAAERTHQAVNDFLNDKVPSHVASIVEQYGTGEEVTKVLAKQSFYPSFENTETETPLVVSKADMLSIIEVFDIQNRPYNRAELHMANEISHLPRMQAAMLNVHERLMSMSESYLSQHPERMTGDMSSWSEIFVPEQQEDGSTVLLPNPKLMRAITNNVLPAVAGRLLERGVDIDEMTVDDIQKGANIAAKKYKLFQAKIGLFRPHADSGSVELGEITTVTCPANQLFPSFLMQYLGVDYAEFENLERL